MGTFGNDSTCRDDNEALDNKETQHANVIAQHDKIESRDDLHQFPEHGKQETGNWFAEWRRESEGLCAWYLMARVFLYEMLTGFTHNFTLFGLLYVEYTAYFGSSKAVLGMIPSLQMGAFAIGGVVASWPLDRYGCSKTAFVGSLLSSVGLISASFANSVPLLCLTQGAITGFGFGITFLCVPVVLQRHFHRNRALVNGLSQLGISFGNIISPIIIKELLEMYGWKGMLLIIGGLSANRAALGLSFCEPKRKRSDADNSVYSSSNTCSQAMRSIVDFSLFRNRDFALFSLALLLQTFYINAYLTFTPSRAVHLGISLSGAAFLSTSSFIGSTSSRLLFMIISNMRCVNHVVEFSLGIATGTVSVLVTLALPDFTGALIGSVLCGVTIGVTNSIVVVLMVELCGLERLSRSLAIYNLIIGTAALIASPLCGWLYDVTSRYDAAFLLMGSAAGWSCILGAGIYVMRRRERIQERNAIELQVPVNNRVEDTSSSKSV